MHLKSILMQRLRLVHDTLREDCKAYIILNIKNCDRSYSKSSYHRCFALRHPVEQLWNFKRFVGKRTLSQKVVNLSAIRSSKIVFLTASTVANKKYSRRIGNVLSSNRLLRRGWSAIA